MANRDFLLALAAGVLSAGLFLLVAVSGLGFLFLFLPSLPLFWIGLGRRPQSAFIAAGAAALIIAAIVGLETGLIYLLLLGLPCGYIAQKSLLWRETPNGRDWFPLGLIWTRLVLYAGALVMLTGWFYAGDGGLHQAVAGHIRDAFHGVDAAYSQAVDLLAGPWAFLIFALPIWLWALSLYGFAWAANRLLIATGRHIRPDFAFTLFPMPHWMLSLLAVGALGSFLSDASLAFLAKSLLVALLLPYFLLGTAWAHASCRTWQNRKLLLFFMYLMIVTQLWPALVVAGFGLMHHIKGLSGGGVSSKH